MHEHLDGASHAPPRAAPAAPGAADPGDEWTELGRRLRFLSRVELFRGLPRDQLTPIATALRPQSVAAGGLICREGEPADRFYLVDTGAVVVSTTIADRAHQLARLGPGQSFGEIALLGHSRRTATVRAEGPVQLWSLTATDFDEVR